MSRSLGQLLSILLVSLFASSTEAQEWTRFRGPNGQGQSEAKLPTTWTENDYNWKIELPGIGHSSPVVWGNQVFIHSADPGEATRYLLAVSAATGKQLWQREFESAPYHIHARSSFASGTPAVDEQAVYLAWATPENITLKAFSHAGETLWETDLGPYVSMHGFGTSPMIYGDLVIVSNQQQSEKLDAGITPGKSFLVAVNKQSGEIAWKLPRGSAVASYGVPCVYKGADGKDQLIVPNTANGIYSVDPLSGELNWEIDTFTMRTVSSPVIVNDLIFGSTCSGGGGNYMVAVQPGTAEKQPEIAFKVDRAAPYVPTVVSANDLLFLFSDKGVVACVDATTGKEHFQKRIGGGFSGSPVRAGAAIYCIREDGVVIVIAAEQEFKLLGENALGEDSRSTPAVSGGRMYLRTYSHLISVGGKDS
jgi:outer membrane protein assembly factor BamB